MRMRCLPPSVALLLLLVVSSSSTTNGFLHRLVVPVPGLTLRTDRWLAITLPQQHQPQNQQRYRIRASLTHRYTQQHRAGHHGGPGVPASAAARWRRTTRTSPIIAAVVQPTRTTSRLWSTTTASAAQISPSLTASAADTPCERSKRRLAGGMAFLTGVANVALTLQFQTFPTMLTGCLLWFSRSIVEISNGILVSPTQVLYYASVLLSYLTGVGVVRRFRHWPPRRILRSVGAIVLTLFVTADVMVYASWWHSSRRFVPVSLLAVAYGMINTMGTDFAGTLTFVVTGHLTRLTHLLSDRVFDGKRLTPPDVSTAKLSLSVCGGFTAGAVLAFCLHQRGCLLRPGFFSLLGMSYAALLASYDGRRIRHWWKRRLVPDMMIRPPLVIVQEKFKSNKVRDVVTWALRDAQESQHPVVVRAGRSSSSSNSTTLIAQVVDEAMAEDRDVVLVQTYLPNQEGDIKTNGAVGRSINSNEEDMVVVVVQNNSTIPPPINGTIDNPRK